MQKAKKMKIFSDKSYLLNSVEGQEIGVVMLYPFWGDPWTDKRHAYATRYDKWIQKGKNLFEMTSLDDADITVFPSQWITKKNVKHFDFLKLFEKFHEISTSHKKRLVVFFQHDSDENITDYSGMLIFRTSLYESIRKPNEFAIPSWSADIIEEYANGQVLIRKKKVRPTVGFCGYPGFPPSQQTQNLKSHIKRILKNVYIKIPNRLRYTRFLMKYNIGHFIRSKAIKILQKSKKIQNNFILRDKIWGGFGHYRLPNGTFNYELTKETYVQHAYNILESDYVLCCRGNGNNSIRMYETLCCGRIPVFINTDCVLPYKNEIDWKRYCIWVEQNELAFIEEMILDFHENISESDFVDLQKECREVYLKYISPYGFFTNFYKHFL